MTAPDSDNTVPLHDLDTPFTASSGSDLTAGHAPGSTSPWPSPPTGPPTPTAPASAVPPMPTGPFTPSTPSSITGTPEQVHPALGPQFTLHAASAVTQSAKKITIAQAKAAAPPTSHIRSTTGWQRS